MGYDHIAEGDLDVWCTAPPQLVEHVKVVSAIGKTIEGAYIDSCFVPEMLTRFKTARRKVLNAMELAQKKGISITALGGFTSIIFDGCEVGENLETSPGPIYDPNQLKNTAAIKKKKGDKRIRIE